MTQDERSLSRFSSFSRLFSEEERDIMQKVRWFLIVAAAATFLQVAIEKLKEIDVPDFILLLLRMLEDIMFICDFIILLLSFIVATLKKINDILKPVGIDVPLYVKALRSSSPAPPTIDHGPQGPP